MIHTDQELKYMQDRITYFEGLVAQFRVTIQPDNFAAMAGGYLNEIARMHNEIIAYLGHHSRDNQPAEVLASYVEGSSTTESIAESASAFLAVPEEERLEAGPKDSVAVGSISGELQNGRENNEVVAMSDWKARKRVKRRAATTSIDKPEAKTAAAMLA